MISEALMINSTLTELNMGRNLCYNVILPLYKAMSIEWYEQVI